MDAGKIFETIIAAVVKLGFTIPGFFLPAPPAPLVGIFEPAIKGGFGLGLVIGAFLYLFSKLQVVRDKSRFRRIYVVAAVLCVVFAIASWWLHFQTEAGLRTRLNILSDGAFSFCLALLLMLIFIYLIEKWISVRKRGGGPPPAP